MASISRLGLSGIPRTLYGDFGLKVPQSPVITPLWRRYIVDLDSRCELIKQESRRYMIGSESRRVIITKDLTKAIFHKDPSEVLDYVLDFSQYLDANELITNHLFTETTGNIALPSSSIIEAGKATQIILSGGILSNQFLINCNITTDKRISTTPSLFRIVDRFITIQVLDI